MSNHCFACTVSFNSSICAGGIAHPNSETRKLRFRKYEYCKDRFTTDPLFTRSQKLMIGVIHLGKHVFKALKFSNRDKGTHNQKTEISVSQ